jgi:hypothetical protein
MLRGTVTEKILLEAVLLCFEEFKRLQANDEPLRGVASDSLTPRFPRLIPVKDWKKFHLNPPLSELRDLMFHKDSNGFNSCVRRIGKKIYIDEDAFFRWVEGKGGE